MICVVHTNTQKRKEKNVKCTLSSYNFDWSDEIFAICC